MFSSQTVNALSNTPTPEAYERLLGDFIAGDSTLFTRSDEVLEAWRIVDSCRAGWKAPFAFYKPGSWGPVEANTLISTHPGASWLPMLTRIGA
jgi:glucose-6-phosphate 1-dehydrogenase